MLSCKYPAAVGTIRSSLAPAKPSLSMSSPCPPPANLSACTPRFTTKKNKKICASPTDPAVQKLMQNLDKKVKNDKKDKKKGQSPRPRGRPKRQRRQRV